MEKPRYFCQECNKELEPDQKVCPICKSSKRLIKMKLEGEIIPRSCIEAKQKRKGVKRPLKEIKKGWSESGDKKKHPKGVIKERVIDREKDIYEEKVDDVETGKTTRCIKEPLSKHEKKKKWRGLKIDDLFIDFGTVLYFL